MKANQHKFSELITANAANVIGSVYLSWYHTAHEMGYNIALKKFFYKEQNCSIALTEVELGLEIQRTKFARALGYFRTSVVPNNCSWVS